MTILRWQTHLGFTKEIGWGNSTTTPSLWVPYSTAKFMDQPKFYYDEAFRSVQAKDFAAYATTLQGNFDFGTDVYVDTFPVLAGVGMVGNTDVVSTVFCSNLNVNYTQGTVSAHTFLLGSPSSLSLFDFNGYSERVYQGARMSEVSIKYTPDSRVEVTYKGDSRLSVINASAANVANAQIGQYTPILAWQGFLTLNNAVNQRLIDFELDLKRGLEVLFTQAGTQSPTNIYAFPMEASGKMTVDFVDETEYNIFRNNVQTAVFDLLFLVSGSNGIRINFPQPVYDSYEVDRGKDFLTAKIGFKSVYNQASSTNVKLIVYNTTTQPY